MEKNEEYKNLINEMQNNGYTKAEHTISKAKTMILGTLVGLVATAILMILYRPLLLNKFPDFELNIPLFVIATIGSIVIHELLHGLVWSLFCKNGWSSIKITWSAFMPSCHCKEPLTTGKYLLGVIAPFVILGIGTSFITFFVTDLMVIFIAAINVIIAGGDLLIAFSLLKAKNRMIIDHPTDPGFVAFQK